MAAATPTKPSAYTTEKFNKAVKRLEEIVSGQEFQGLLGNFVQVNCIHFEEGHRTEKQVQLHKTLFEKYNTMIESHIEKKMLASIPGFSTATFLDELFKREESEVDQKVYNLLGTLGDENHFQMQMKQAKAKLAQAPPAPRSPTLEERDLLSPEAERKRKRETAKAQAQEKTKESRAFPSKTPVDVSGIRGKYAIQVNGKRGLVLGLAKNNKLIKVAIMGASKVHEVNPKNLKKAKRVPPNSIAKVSELGKRRAYREVWGFKKLKTNGALTREDMLENDRGLIVSRVKHYEGKKMYVKKGLNSWVESLAEAREEQKVDGFLAVKKNGTKAQKKLYARAEQLYKDKKAAAVLKNLMDLDKRQQAKVKDLMGQKDVASKLKWLPTPPSAKKKKD